MPSIRNIDKFVQLLNTLGDEPRILETRGQNIEPAVVPDKSQVENNPFLVNIEDESQNNLDDDETPNLSDQLNSFDDLGLDDDSLFDSNDAPELEMNDDFSLDQIDDYEDIESIDDISELEDENLLEDLDSLTSLDNEEDSLLDDLDSLTSLDNEEDSLLDDLDSLTSLDNEEDSLLDDLDSLTSLDNEEDSLLDDLDSLTSLDNEEDPLLDDLDSLTSLDNEDDSLLDDLDSLTSLDNEDDSLLDDLVDFEDIESLDEVSEVEDLEEMEPLEDDGIKDISFEDIGIEEIDEAVSLEDDFDSLSIEDEVLEADFGSLDDDESDQFSLGDFGDSFNIDQDSSSSLSLEEFSDNDTNENTEVEKEVTYTQEEFESIKKTLASLPLNLKLVIEEEIAENGLFGQKLHGLIDLLIDDAPIKDIVKYVNKKLGHNIKVSSSFIKLTAEEFERKKKRFSYILINSVFPKLKWIFPVTILLALLYIAGYFWGYKIIKSESIYKEGHELILIDKYEEAYEKFLEAFNVHRKMKWYYIYADTYYERKAFNYAENIYNQIINENSKDQHAIISYAHLKGFDQGSYETATYFLIDIIDHGNRTFQIMEKLGDLYMAWAKIDSSHYEDARLWYAEVMNNYGAKPEILFRYLNYFIETDNLDEVLRYRRMFEISTEVVVNGDSYAKMAGYLLDKGVIENVRDTLFRGITDNPRNPNIHYQLARYFDKIENTREVEKAARNAIFYYEYGGYLNPDELASLVDSKRILGNLYSKDERYMAAEKNYKEAVSLYENLLDRNFVNKSSKYGEIYADYGDIFYYASNSYLTAFRLYTKAEENSYTTPELSYKKGFVDYQFNNMKDALLEFHNAEDISENREQIMFAKANTLSYRGSYSSALTYYNMHLKIIQKMEEEEEILYPSENEAHLALIENYIRLYNNMGVTLYKLYGEKALPEVGMSFTKSTEYYDYLTRDPDLLIRSGLKDLAYYNTKAILYPEKDIELLLYNSISKDFSDLNLGIVSNLE